MRSEYNIKEKLSESFKQIYREDSSAVQQQYQRFSNLIQLYKTKFNADELFFFSTPGRTEIGGNHTDHNNGKVLAASINLDSIAVTGKTNDNLVRIYSEGFESEIFVNLNILDKRYDEKETTVSLVRGIADYFSANGYNIGGFNAFFSSDVLVGSGLSSSASIEILIGTIFNNLFNEGKVTSKELAVAGQYSENEHFGKPCGLMDQIACAAGGIVTIDFADNKNPVIEKVEFDFNACNYSVVVVNTGGNHADLTSDYASIPIEMKHVAAFFNKTVCRQISIDELLSNAAGIREKCGDRAFLRVFHFLQENERVEQQVKMLKEGNFSEFLRLVNESGNSSFRWLQNVFSVSNVKEQGISTALALSEKFLKENNCGVCRVHGGGFAGTIQVFIKNDFVSDYTSYMEKTFGENTVTVLSIREKGTAFLGSISSD